MIKRIAIVGSRDFKELHRVRRYIWDLSKLATIVSGGARGVDQAAEDAAKQTGHQFVVYRADWDKHGKSAGMIRNAEIVANCDKLVAFWDGKSRGTKNSIERALQASHVREVIVIKETPS